MCLLPNLSFDTFFVSSSGRYLLLKPNIDSQFMFVFLYRQIFWFNTVSLRSFPTVILLAGFLLLSRRIQFSVFLCA